MLARITQLRDQRRQPCVPDRLKLRGPPGRGGQGWTGYIRRVDPNLDRFSKQDSPLAGDSFAGQLPLLDALADLFLRDAEQGGCLTESLPLLPMIH